VRALSMLRERRKKKREKPEGDEKEEEEGMEWGKRVMRGSSVERVKCELRPAFFSYPRIRALSYLPSHGNDTAGESRR